MAYADINGRKIYYEEYSDSSRPTVVYMHGGPGESCRTYTYQAQKLGETMHVISFDQYGVFRSDAIPEEQPAGVMFHIGLIEELRKSLGIDKWIPLGHSFGGMLALIYAHEYPEHTQAVIYDCPMWSALHTARAIADMTLPFYDEHGMTEQADSCRAILREGVSAKEAFERAVALEMGLELQRFCHSIDMEDYNRYISEHIPDIDAPEECWYRYASFNQKLFDSEDFYEDYLPFIAEVKKPQLLMVGEYDMTCGRFEQEYFRRNAPDGSFRLLENSAHLSWFEHPEKYTELVDSFVNGL